MENKYKKFIALSVGALCLPFIIYFFIITCGREVLHLISMDNVIYFNWRTMPILSIVPFVFYFEIIVISCFFTKDKKAYPFLLKYMTRVSGFNCILFFLVVLLQPVITIGFALSSYHSCPVDGIFSGVYYVKDKSMCSELTSSTSWEGK
jgi:hypothetical protein